MKPQSVRSFDSEFAATLAQGRLRSFGIEGRVACRTLGLSRKPYFDLVVDEADAAKAAVALPGGESPADEAKMPLAVKLVFAFVAAAIALSLAPYV